MTVLRAPLCFLLVILLFFSSFTAIPVSATPEPKELWTIEYEGEPLFEPVLNKDDNLVVGKYSIIDDVYKNDIMTIDKKNGEILKKWSFEFSKSYHDHVLTDKYDNIYIYNYDYKHSTVTIYNENGSKLVNHKIMDKNDFLYSVNIYIDDEEIHIEQKYHNYLKDNSQYITDIYSLDGTYIEQTQEESEDVPYYHSAHISAHISKDNNEEITVITPDKTYAIPLSVNSGDAISDYIRLYFSSNNIIYVLASTYDKDTYENTSKQIAVIDQYNKKVTKPNKIENLGEYYEAIGSQNNLHLIADNGTYTTIDQNGNILNQRNLGYVDPWSIQTQYVNNNQLYMLFDDTAILADDSGKIIWEKKIDWKQGDYYSSKYIYDILNNIYIYDNSNVLSQNKNNGSIEWTYTLTKSGYLAELLIDEPNNTAYYQAQKWEETELGDLSGKKYSTILSAFSFGEEGGIEPTNSYLPNKTWTITFNSNIDPNSVDEKSIYVLDANGDKVSGITYKFNNEKVEVIAPKEGYQSNQSYTLVITTSVQSTSKQVLKEVITKEFHIK